MVVVDDSLRAMSTPASPSISWYHTPLPREELRRLLQKSSRRAWLQTAGYLAVIVSTGILAVWVSRTQAWPWFIPAFFLHGTVMAFLINAVHELGHGTVFPQRWLNQWFCGLFAFLGWINHLKFQESHGRHHRYTLHYPHDQEVVSPDLKLWGHFIRHGFINVDPLLNLFRFPWEAITGRMFAGSWNETCFPADNRDHRRRVVAWSRWIVGGHVAISAIALSQGWWAVPLIVSLHGLCGSWLFWLCNNTQHSGLPGNTPDARVCCRTFTANPVVSFLYWHMNFHIEHHMYAAVPCYRLAELHRAIRHDLPPTPHGLRAVWREITACQAKMLVKPATQSLRTAAIEPRSSPA